MKRIGVFLIFLAFSISSFGQEDFINNYRDILLDKESEKQAVGMSLFAEERREEVLFLIDGKTYEYEEFVASQKHVMEELNSLYIYKDLHELIGCTDVEKKYLIVISTERSEDK